MKFFLQPTYSTSGIVVRPSPGLSYSYLPWYTEIAVELHGADCFAVVYSIPRDGEQVFLASCLDETFESFFRLVSGADFGDAVAGLTAQEWPDVFSMLVRSSDSAVDGRVIANVATSGRVQWIIADQVRPSEADDVSSEQLLDLIGASLRTFLRTSGLATELPGLIKVLGGPDRTTRRLAAMSDLVGAVSDIGGGLAGGINADELVALGKGALDAVSSMRALKD